MSEFTATVTDRKKGLLFNRKCATLNIHIDGETKPRELSGPAEWFNFSSGDRISILVEDGKVEIKKSGKD